MSESAGRPDDMMTLNISQKLYDDLVRDAMSWRSRASHAEREGAGVINWTTEGCAKHNGQSWTFTARAYTVLGKRCPLCEPEAFAGKDVTAALESLRAPSTAGPDALAEEITRYRCTTMRTAGIPESSRGEMVPIEIGEWVRYEDVVALLRSRPADRDAAFDMRKHLVRQREWSERTFGPGARTAGVIDHIRKELKEIEDAPGDVSEWIDVTILALDGAWRAGFTPEQIVAAIQAKQAKNETRKWPDWRTSPADKAIEHDRADAAMSQQEKRDG